MKFQWRVDEVFSLKSTQVSPKLYPTPMFIIFWRPRRLYLRLVLIIFLIKVLLIIEFMVVYGEGSLWTLTGVHYDLRYFYTTVGLFGMRFRASVHIWRCLFLFRLIPVATIFFWHACKLIGKNHRQQSRVLFRLESWTIYRYAKTSRLWRSSGWIDGKAPGKNHARHEKAHDAIFRHQAVCAVPRRSLHF